MAQVIGHEASEAGDAESLGDEAAEQIAVAGRAPFGVAGAHFDAAAGGRSHATVNADRGRSHGGDFGERQVGDESAAGKSGSGGGRRKQRRVGRKLDGHRQRSGRVIGEGDLILTAVVDRIGDSNLDFANRGVEIRAA